MVSPESSLTISGSAADPTLAKENRFDVVLIDTAGRMQDNEPLMRALAKVSNALTRVRCGTAADIA